MVKRLKLSIIQQRFTETTPAFIDLLTKQQTQIKTQITLLKAELESRTTNKPGFVEPELENQWKSKDAELINRIEEYERIIPIIENNLNVADFTTLTEYRMFALHYTNATSMNEEDYEDA